jgi:tetratricopeptide (TPR) repeat protein
MYVDKMIADAGRILLLTLVFSGVLELSPRAFAHGDRHELAARITQKLEAHPEDPELLIERSRVFVEVGHWNDAVADLEKARRIAPKATDYPLEFGRLHAASHDYRNADAEFSKSIEVSQKALGRTYLERAYARIRQDRLQEAIADFEMSMMLIGIHPEVVLECSTAYAISGQGEKSIECLQRGLSELGNLPVLQEQLVNRLVENDRLEEALKVLEVMLDSFPRKERLLSRRAEIHLKLKNVQQARKNLEEARACFNRLPEVVRKRPMSRDIFAEIVRLEKEIAVVEEKKHAPGT